MNVPSGSGRGGYAKGDARRVRIIEVATEVFGTQGFRAATMLQIAAACEISRTGLLHHFPTKEALLEAVLDHRDGPVIELPESGEPGPDERAGDPRELLLHLIAVVEHNATQPRIVNLFSVLAAEAGDPHHPAHSYFKQRYARLRDAMRKAMRRLAADGELTEHTDPDLFAAELIALMDGLQVQWVLAADEIDMAAVLRQRIAGALVEPLARDLRR